MPDGHPSDHPERARLPLTFDAPRMLAEIHALGLPEFVYYDALPLRGPAHLIDSALPLPPPATDYADGSWTPWLNAPALEGSPYLQEVIATFQEHTTVNLVRVLRLAPGAVVDEHTDPTLALHIERSMVRLTIPVQSPPGMAFVLNGTPVPLQPGECWYLRLTDPHRVSNPSEQERINVTIDVIPNAWVRELVEAA